MVLFPMNLSSSFSYSMMSNLPVLPTTTTSAATSAASAATTAAATGPSSRHDHVTAITKSSTPLDRGGERHRRTQFLLFIKILFRCLEKSEDQLLHEQAKLIVFRCRRERPSTMQEAITVELRALVGEAMWGKAQRLASYYYATRQASRGHRQQKAAASAAAAAAFGTTTTTTATASSSSEQQNIFSFPTTLPHTSRMTTDVTERTDDQRSHDDDDDDGDDEKPQEGDDEEVVLVEV